MTTKITQILFGDRTCATFEDDGFIELYEDTYTGLISEEDYSRDNAEPHLSLRQLTQIVEDLGRLNYEITELQVWTRAPGGVVTSEPVEIPARKIRDALPRAEKLAKVLAEQRLELVRVNAVSPRGVAVGFEDGAILAVTGEELTDSLHLMNSVQVADKIAEAESFWHYDSTARDLIRVADTLRGYAGDDGYEYTPALLAFSATVAQILDDEKSVYWVYRLRTVLEGLERKFSARYIAAQIEDGSLIEKFLKETGEPRYLYRALASVALEKSIAAS